MNSRTRTHAGTLLILSAALSTAVLLIIVGYTGKTPAAAAQNVVATLYDGSLGGGTQTPDDQEFSYSALVLPPLTVQASQSASGGVTTLDTMDQREDYAGYAHDATLLDRTLGYTITFSVQVVSETHASNDRAGFSIIALSSDLEGIELGFWTDSIWAQHDDTTGSIFTHAEETAFDTTSGLITYDLVIQGNTYSLRAGGTEILSGTLRNYTAWEPALPFIPDPYETENFIFLGDDTSSARAEIRLSLVSVTWFNAPPTFTSTPVTAASPGLLYSYTATASDQNSEDVLTISAPTLPAWLSLGPTTDGTATLSGTPASSDIGQHAVGLLVTDSSGATDTQTFTITVSAQSGNDPPVFGSIPVTAAAADTVYTYVVTATDVDASDVLTISASTLPAWLSLGPTTDGTATLSGTPASSDIGQHAVGLLVTDSSGATDTQTFTITVSAQSDNTAPTFTSTPITAATAGTAYNYEITATDADAGDVLTISAPTLPAWLSLGPTTDGTATLSGLPALSDTGPHTISLLVSDSAGATDTQDFTITVAAPSGNNPPIFGSTPIVTAAVGLTYTYTITATDVDASDVLTISAPTLPAWLSLGPTTSGTATLSGLPALSDTGPHTVRLLVTDSAGSSDEQNFTITVVASGDGPSSRLFLPIIVRGSE